MREGLALGAAVDLTRTGDVWLFRGRSAADQAIRAVTNAPVNHVGMAVVLEDLPPLLWHAELGRSLPDAWTAERGPLLLMAAGLDRTVPVATVRAAHKIQSRNPGVTELVTFPGRAHSYGADSGWREVAETALAFLARHGIGAPSGVATT